MKKDFYKHIIFDWNGTLLNDTPLHYELCQKAFSEYNMKPISFDEYREKTIFPQIDFYKKYGFDEKKYDYNELTERYHERYLKRINELALFPDVKEILDFFKSNNVSLSILSALEQTILINSVKKLGIYDYFDDIRGLDNMNAGSKADNALKWFNSNNYKKDEILMIGDTVHDSDVAKSLGIDCFLVSRGVQSEDELLKTGYKVFSSLKEVLEYFKKEYLN